MLRYSSFSFCSKKIGDVYAQASYNLDFSFVLRLEHAKDCLPSDMPNRSFSEPLVFFLVILTGSVVAAIAKICVQQQMI